MGRWWRGARGLMSASTSASRSLSNQAQVRAASRRLRRDTRAASRGVVGPWDPPVPPGVSGYLDYSGLARPEDIGPVSNDFPLGRYVVPKGQWEVGEAIGLPLNVLGSHAVVVAPTGSGKTSSIIAPWIHGGLRAGFTVVAVDVKGNGDLIQEVLQYAASQPPIGGAPIVRWDYRDPGRSMSWNWLSELNSDGAVNAAVEAICGRGRDNDPNRNFHLRDMKYLRGLLDVQRCLRGPVTVRNLVQFLEDQDALRSLVSQAGATRGAGRLQELCGLSQHEYAKAVQFVLTHLETLDTDGFNAVTKVREFEITNLDALSGYLVVINSPVADQTLSAEASGLFLSQLIYHRLGQFGSPGSPLLLVLDEAPRLQDRIDLRALLSLSRGAGMSIVIAAQDVTQFEEGARSEILSNCSTFVCLPGVSQATTSFFGGRLGTRRITSVSHSQSVDLERGRGLNVSRSIEEVPVLGHSEISSPPFSPYSAIVHSRNLSHKPILVDLLRSDL